MNLEQETPRAGRRVRLAVCLAIFTVQAAWVVIWPYTGDGDSMMHYLNVRDSARHPAFALGPWARPAYVVLTLLPAAFGVVAARCFAALLSTVLAWQTMRLADDLKLPNATLAGPLVLLQPLAFALASDTMTEMPAALGFVLAIRLWWAGRYAASCLLVSFLPMVRPEGFFLVAMWGIMALLAPGAGAAWRRVRNCLLLGVGTACWIAACRALTGDPLYFLAIWSWPTRSYPSYGRGSLLHHVVLWPYYCGPVLIVLFLAGLRASWNRKMALPWAVWGMVFGVHSVLRWLGMFAALGLMRIQACTSPVTAVVCLYGWNAIGGWLRRRSVSPGRIRAARVAALAVAAASVGAYYWIDEEHHRCFPIRQTVEYVRQEGLLQGAPRFFTGESIVLAELGLTTCCPQVVENAWDPNQQRELLANLPAGSVGLWDNQRSSMWYTVTIEELLDMGYRIVHEVRYRPPRVPVELLGFPPLPEYQRYVILRKY